VQTGPGTEVGRRLADLVGSLVSSRGAARVLDCGGGSGRFAVPLAAAGAQVTVVDVSADALSTLQLRAAEAGVAELVQAVQGEVEALGASGLHDQPFDLVLAHGVLNAVDDVEAAFASIAQAVRPGGLLSVLAANPVAAVLARVLAGDVAGALHDLERWDASLPGHDAGPDRVGQLCTASGFLLEQTTGVGVFREIVPGAALEVPGSAAALEELERRCSSRFPFAHIAALIHLLARRPANGEKAL
jgi:SAM-dependent methyltransferase